jgi:hypothetical protein
MRLTARSSTFPYKTLIGYGVAAAVILLLAVPVFANNRPVGGLLDFSRSSTTGLSIQSAQTLSKGININHLNPGQENWYVYSRDSFQDPAFSWVSLALRYESEAVIAPNQVNFEVFAEEPGGWFQQAAPATEPLGEGLASPLRAAQNRVETFWTGQVSEQETYYIRVFNESPFGLDYTLEAKAEQPAVSGATPASLNAARKNAIPQNIRQMAWTLTAQAVENMPATQAASWMQQAQAVGWIVTDGTPIDEIPNPAEASPQMLWQLTAQAIEGQDAETATQWLTQADSLGWLAIPLNTVKQPFVEEVEDIGGGDDGGAGDVPAVPAEPKAAYAPVNIYPNNPLPFNLSEVNSGRLAPYGEHWYQLTRDDLDSDLIENMKMTMFFTPIQGFMSNRINFEIIPASQYHIWQRGDADYLEHLGLGMWVSRDEDPLTGERLWNGTLIDGDSYFVKVKNGTAEEVDYYLYPDDVENAELGNPTLHNADAGVGRIPYAAAPPTRSKIPPAPGDSPAEAIPLESGSTIGTLDAGEEIWYSLYHPNANSQSVSERDYKIYLTNTPLDGVIARHADFALYPGGQFHLWARGTIDELAPLGHSAPSDKSLSNNKSLQVLWDGQLLDGNLYYIKVFNHDIGPLEYELEISRGS